MPGFVCSAGGGVKAVAGSATTNKIPKFNADLNLVDSLLSDNGTNVTLLGSGQLLAPNGSAGGPAYSFSNFPTHGLLGTTSNLSLAVSGAIRLVVWNDGQVNSSGALGAGTYLYMGGTATTRLYEQAAGDLLLNSDNLVTTSCSLRIPNAITGGSLGPSPTNSSQGRFYWVGNVFTIAISETGSGVGVATGINLGIIGGKVGFYGQTPIARHSSTGETVGFTAGAGTSVNDDSTFTGNVGATAYRLSDIVKALKNIGILTA